MLEFISDFPSEYKERQSHYLYLNYPEAPEGYNTRFFYWHIPNIGSGFWQKLKVSLFN